MCPLLKLVSSLFPSKTPRKQTFFFFTHGRCQYTSNSNHALQFSLVNLLPLEKTFCLRDGRYGEAWRYSGWMWLGSLLSVYFQWVSSYGSCSLAVFTGVDQGGCCTFQWLKERFLYLSASSASNGSQREIFKDLLGYWAKRKICQEIFDSFAIVSWYHVWVRLKISGKQPPHTNPPPPLHIEGGCGKQICRSL